MVLKTMRHVLSLIPDKIDLGYNGSFYLDWFMES